MLPQEDLEASEARSRTLSTPRRSSHLSVLAIFYGLYAVIGITTQAFADELLQDRRSLESRILPFIEAHRGKVAVAVKHLSTGESYTYRSGEVMPTASLIKFPVMIEAYRQAGLKKVDLSTMVTLRKQDKVPGSGILTNHFTPGTQFPLLDAVHLMIVYSDNTATNLVLDAIGIGATAATMETLGYPNTKIHSKVFRRDTSIFPDRSKKYGLGSTTASDMISLFESLHKKQLVSPEASEAMLVHLRGCDDKDKFPRFLPAGTKIAFKTGSVDASRTAAGIIDCPAGPVAVCVLTDENEDRRWVADNAGNRLCAEVARQVFEHYQKPATADSNRTQAASVETAPTREGSSPSR